MNGVQLPQGYRATSRRQFTFYHQISGKSWYSFDRHRLAELTVLGKMPPRKVAPRKMPPGKVPPEKLPPGNLPPGENTRRKIAPRLK